MVVTDGEIGTFARLIIHPNKQLTGKVISKLVDFHFSCFTYNSIKCKNALVHTTYKNFLH